MTQRLSLLGVLLTALTSGCVVPSLHPIYTSEDAIFEEKLLGEWQEDKPDSNKESKTRWQFSKAVEKPKGKAGAAHDTPEKPSYRLLISDDDKQAEFLAHLAKIQDTLFLDVQPADPELKKVSERQLGLLIPAHTFFWVESIDPQLQIRILDPGWLKKLLKKSPEAIAHQVVDDRIILTAPTPELQKFFLQHTKTKGAYKDPGKFKRVNAN